MIEGAKLQNVEVSTEDIKQHVLGLMSSGESTSSAAKIASQQLGVRRKQAYAAALEMQDAKE